MNTLSDLQISLLPRALDDLRRISAYWLHNVSKQDAHLIIEKLLKDLRFLTHYHLSCETFPGDPLKSMSFKIHTIGSYVFIFKKIEHTIFVYHITHADSEYKGAFKITD